MEKEYIFTKREEVAIKRYAEKKISSRELGECLNVSHTRAIHIAGRYFIQLYSKGKLVVAK